MIAVVLVTLTVAPRQGSRVRLRNLVLVTAVAVPATVALFVWWLALPDALSLAPSPVTSGIRRQPRGAPRWLRPPGRPAAGAGPAPRRTPPHRRDAWRRSPALTAVVGAGSTLWMAASYLRVPDVPFVGNYLDLYGVLSRDVLPARACR